MACEGGLSDRGDRGPGQLSEERTPEQGAPYGPRRVRPGPRAGVRAAGEEQAEEKQSLEAGGSTDADETRDTVVAEPGPQWEGRGGRAAPFLVAPERENSVSEN